MVTDDDGNEIFAPSFSMWTTIEECLNPPVIWEQDGELVHDARRSREPEVFDFPEGIGPVECVNVEHEEVLLMPRWVDCKRATFKYGLGDEFINILKVLHTLGLDSTEKVRVKGVEVSPRDVVAAVLPDPATVGPRMKGKTCAGLWVTGTGKDGQPRSTYLYHVVDNEWTMREYGHQCVVWQTAINPVVALELLARGTWSGAGVLGPEAFDAVPFLDLLTEYGSPWGMQELGDVTQTTAPTLSGVRRTHRPSSGGSRMTRFPFALIAPSVTGVVAAALVASSVGARRRPRGRRHRTRPRPRSPSALSSRRSRRARPAPSSATCRCAAVPPPAGPSPSRPRRRVSTTFTPGRDGDSGAEGRPAPRRPARGDHPLPLALRRRHRRAGALQRRRHHPGAYAAAPGPPPLDHPLDPRRTPGGGARRTRRHPRHPPLGPRRAARSTGRRCSLVRRARRAGSSARCSAPDETAG